MKIIPKKFLILSLFLLSLFTSIEALIQTADQVTWEDKVGQMFLVGFRGTDTQESPFIIKLISDFNIGGVILFDYDVPSQSFPRNILNPEQTKILIRDLQSSAKTPLLIAIDAEGGRINRLKPEYGFLEIPSAQRMGLSDSKIVKSTAQKLADQLSDIGVNLNLAPVVDLNLNPKNPIIGSLERSFSQKPQIVIEKAVIFINAHKGRGVITALKHFPGHGSSQHDSHLGVVDVTKSYQEDELLPYKVLIAEGKAEMIMTAHIMNLRIDPEYPATLSRKFIQDILRGRLKYQGVVISDDMQMEAIAEHFGFKEAVVLAVKAGCDILAFSNNGKTYDETAVYDALHVVLDGIKSGRISAQRINESYQKIIRLKQRYGII